MNIGVFGLGIIGSIWAENLHKDGHHVLRWNRTPKPVTGFTADAREVAQKSTLLMIVVTDAAAVQSVLDQIIPVLNTSHIVLQNSTISPASSQSFAAQVAKTGAAFLEAPFTGSKPAAEQRKTIFFIGGETSVLERARPALQTISCAIEHIGAVGTASALKLSMNVNIALVASALCESLSLARAAGIPDERYFSALRLNASHSKLADMKQPKLQTADFSPQFSIKNMAKDLRLAREAAGDLNLAQTKTLLELYDACTTNGWSSDDFISTARLAKP